MGGSYRSYLSDLPKVPRGSLLDTNRNKFMLRKKLIKVKLRVPVEWKFKNYAESSLIFSSKYKKLIREISW